MGTCPGFSSRCKILSCHDSVSVPGEAAQEPKSLRLGTFAPLRCCYCLSQVERSHEPEPGLFPAVGGVAKSRKHDPVGACVNLRLAAFGQGRRLRR